MRFLALLYLAIALISFSLWLDSGLDVELLPNPAAYLNWALFVFSLMSLSAFVMRWRILPQRVWQLVFVVYCAMRMYELTTRGLSLSGADMATNLNIITSYLWILLPPGMAMWYMGFVSRTSKPAMTRRSRDSEHVSILRQHYTEQLP
jgi:hypothetical protein